MTVSVRDVARAAGVSVGTVSNVLNSPHKVAPHTADRVHSAITRLGFVRNDAARQLRVGRSRSIGVVVLDVANPFFAEVVRGAEDRAAPEGLAVLVGNSAESSQRERDYLELFQEQRLTGVLITPTSADRGRLLRLRDAGTVVVLVDREIQGAPFASVSVDDVEGGRLAARHLLATGRRRLLYVGGPLGLPQVADRLAGARDVVDAQSDARLEVVVRPALTVAEGRHMGDILTSRPVSERPDAVFCANDMLAIGIMQALVLTGVRVPEDVALIGYDDIDFAGVAVVSLSSIRQPAARMGATAVDLLLGELRGGDSGRQVRFSPELVARRSTTG